MPSFSLLPDFSKNMKSMRKTAPRSTAWKVYNFYLTFSLISFVLDNFMHIMTILRALFTFALTSRSCGKLTPKLSASVNASLPSPDHCLLILPISFPSGVSTYEIYQYLFVWSLIYLFRKWVQLLQLTLNSTSPQKLQVQKGPFILMMGFSAASLRVNSGKRMVQSCSTVPRSMPPWAVTCYVFRLCNAKPNHIPPLSVLDLQGKASGHELRLG